MQHKGRSNLAGFREQEKIGSFEKSFWRGIRPFRRLFREKRRNAIILHRGLNTEEGRVAVLNRILACFPRQTVPFSEFSSCEQEKHENAKRALKDLNIETASHVDGFSTTADGFG